MDRHTALVRNSQVRARASRPLSRQPASDAATAPAAALMVDVVVLSGDTDLYEAIRRSVGERNPVWRARSAEESVDLLLTGRCGVLLIDLAAVSTRPTTLIEQVVGQFPDVVVVVAGRREDESVLAGLISDGLVYRFMHKPLSPKRAGMFLNASIRSHVERREGRVVEPLLPLVRELRSRVDPRRWMFVGAAMILFLAVLATVLVSRYGKVATPDAAARGPALSTAPLADPVLSRARAALAAGRLEAPPARNALDLFSAVLLTRPDDLEAQQGLQTTITRLVDQARSEAAAGDVAEARRLARRVLNVDAGNEAAETVITSLAPRTPPVPAAPPPVQSDPDEPSVPRVAPVADPPLRAAAPVTKAPVAPVADPRLLAAVPVTRLPVGPVTKLAPVPPPAARTVVRPDPLTPRVLGPGALPTSPGGRPQPLALRGDRGTTTPGGTPADGPARPATRAARIEPPPFASGTAPGVQQHDLQPLATPGPTYPPAALRQRLQGWVEVEYTVNERGTTGDIAVVDSEPRGVFDQAAVEAVAAWTYRPRVVNGAPVAQRTSVKLRFSVEE